MRNFGENKLLYITGILVIIIFIAPKIVIFNILRFYQKSNPKNSLIPPFWINGGDFRYPLGTDGLGRDLLSRLIYGLRASVFVGIASVGFAIIIGATVGLIAGYFGGLVDTILMRLVEIQLAFPIIVLAVIILTVVRPSLYILIVVFGLSLWPIYARVARLWTMIEKQSYYIDAAKLMGASTYRIIFKYFLKMLGPLILEVGVTDVGTVIIYEAMLGFLGLGIQPPTPSWGNIIADGKIYINNAIWISTMPGILIAITVVIFTLFSDALKRETTITRVRM
mgnify:CR=1 FL=1